MKRKPAFAEEEDPETGEAVLGTESSASFSLSPEQSRERRKTWRRSASDFVSDSESSYLGSLLDVLKQSKEEESLLTIVAGEFEHDDTPTAEAWKECENSGTKFRLFPIKDTVINGENNTYIAREILLSKEQGDLDRENPDLIVVQRKCTRNASISLDAHRLFFRGRLDVDRPYIFPKLGDEIPGVGCPDIHFTFRGIRDWHTVVKGAKFASFDRNVTIDITAEDIESGRKVMFDIERDEVVGSDMKPALGVLISCADFKSVYAGSHVSKEDSPASKKRRMGDTKPHPGGLSKAIELKLIGMGPEIVNGALRADLNIILVIKN
ncbi:hypothetical protein BDZ45DRAFT_811008 [Acephala macrosclerotiorum]|nr:hypothetical protein BDZ45DRAFT_811008 [Acephala macrosclerotiorum]